MDVYTPDNCFRIDDLLDFSNEDLFTPTTTSTSTADHHPPPPQIPSLDHLHLPSDFTDHLSLSLCCDDVAELEWLSRFVDDSFADFPPHSSLAGTGNFLSKASFSGQAAYSATFMQESNSAAAGKVKSKKKTSRATSPTAEGSVRRCTHCASEKTPQWRTGPLGPKTLCNACGVRYKSGRLVPEYRPAASPTFTMTQHSNSHRKVMELRRQKEMLTRRQHQPQDRWANVMTRRDLDGAKNVL